MKYLFKYIKPHMAMVVVGAIIKLSGAVTELMIPYLMEIMLDKKVPEGDMQALYLLGGGMILCAVMTMTFNIVSNRVIAFNSAKMIRGIRHDLFAKIEKLSARQMDELTTSSAVSRLTSDTYNVNQMLVRIQRMGIRAPAMLVGGIIMMLTMDAVLSLVLVALLPIIALVTYIVTKKSVPLHNTQQVVLDDVVQTVQENITGIRVIKALSKTEYEKGRFHKVNERLAVTGLKAGLVAAISNPVSTLVLNLGLTLAIFAGAYRVNSGLCEVGVVMAFLQYFTQILHALLGVTRIFIMCSKGIASANRVSGVLQMPEDLVVEPAAQEAPEGAPHIEFRNVSFSYTGVGKNLDNLSFCLQKGQTLGILGAIGSGKSTIVNLLMRMYDPDEGQILIDGQDIRTLEPEKLRQKFGTVFQNDFITEGTIAHNIRFFRDLTPEDLQRAARDAQAEAFIGEKEGGMDADVVVRGNNLSGGQKQRLLIARALASNPEILVLDDASSALDYQTDAKLRKALRQGYRDTTTLLIAQRVSSLRHADLILVMHDGQVLGAGDHDHLMETCEEYRHIAHTQMGSGKEAI